MIKRLTLRSNGQLIGVDEQNKVLTSVNLLEEAVTALIKTGLAEADTELLVPLMIEPVKLKEWFEIPVKE